MALDKLIDDVLAAGSMNEWEEAWDKLHAYDPTITFVDINVEPLIGKRSYMIRRADSSVKVVSALTVDAKDSMMPSSFSMNFDDLNARYNDLDDEWEIELTPNVGVLNAPEPEYPKVSVHHEGSITIIDQDGDVIEVDEEQAELLQDRLAWALNALSTLRDRTPF